jgi:hypothetical protein
VPCRTRIAPCSNISGVRAVPGLLQSRLLALPALRGSLRVCALSALCCSRIASRSTLHASYQLSDLSESQTIPNLGLLRVSDCSAAWIAPCRVLSARSVRGLLRARYLTLHADPGSLRVSDRSAPQTVPCSTPAALCLSLTPSRYGSLRIVALSASRIAPCRHLRSSPGADCSVLDT